MAKAKEKALAAAKAVKATAVQGPQKGSKAWIITGVMVLVLLALGGQIYFKARAIAKLKFDMVRTGKTVPQGADRCQASALTAIAGDKQDNAWVLTGDAGTTPRLQRFDPQASGNCQGYEPKKPEELIRDPKDMDTDAQGNAYVLTADGSVLVIGPDMKFQRLIRTGVMRPSALAVNSAGRIYVSSYEGNKVAFFTNAGQPEGEFGAPGTNSGDIIQPFRMRITANDRLVVLERTPTGLRGVVFNPEHKAVKRFLVDKAQDCIPLRMGINAENKLFINDHLGGRGVVVWDIDTGKFYGETQATKDGEKFVAPGAIGANKFTRSVYVHTVVGLIKCTLPTDAE
jgi:sugar lactone lactonase YvrE